MSTHYAECVECGEKTNTRAAALAHSSSTMQASGADSGVTASGHSFTVVNPTPDELNQRRIDSKVNWAIDDAIQSAIEELERDVERGDITAAEVASALNAYPDFADAWDEYRAEMDS